MSPATMNDTESLETMPVPKPSFLKHENLSSRRRSFGGNGVSPLSLLRPPPSGKDSRVSSMATSDFESDTGTLVSSPLDFKNGALYNDGQALAPLNLNPSDEKVQAIVKHLVAMLGNQALEESDRPRIVSRPTYISSSSSLSTLSNLQAIESSADDSASYISPPDTPFSKTHFAVPESGKKGSAVDEDTRISPVPRSTTASSLSPSTGDAEAEIATSRQPSTAVDCGEDSISYGEYIVEFPPGISSPAPSLSRFYLRRSSVGETVVLEIPSPQRAEVEVYQEESAPKDLIAPVRPLDNTPPKREPAVSKERPSTDSSNVPSPITVAVEPPVSNLPEQAEPVKRWWQISLARKQSAAEKPVSVVVAADQSAIILPTPPTDVEKTIYAQTRRLPLYLFGTMSFLSVSVGMWFFTISSKMFYWFGVFVGLIQLYLIISYMVGYCGKDFNVPEHRKLVEEHSYPSEKLPLVDIYLPCCHEPIEVLENTYKYVSQLKYPNYRVYVLDDGGLQSVKSLATHFGFNYITRDNKPYLKKAGNLRYAFTRTEGDFFVIFDADFCPRADFLDEMLPYMNKYPDIAIVQSPQFFRPSEEQTWVEQGASATQELFYRIVQVNRDRWGASICVGSNALYRRAALVEVGGTAEIGHSEDVHTGFYALTRGWRLKYIPLALACGVSPDTPRAFFSQQMRWCAGSTTLLTNPDFWKSELSIIQKVCYMSGMMYYTAAALMSFLASTPGLLMLLFNPGMVMWFNFAYAFPSLIYSIVIFRLWSRQMYNFNVNFVFVIQQYAYLMAIKDRIFGTTASWVPSGDNKSHVKDKKKKVGNNKYRNMRILCGLWMGSSAAALAIGITFRILEGHTWYNFLPLILLDTFNLFIAHKFIFYSS